MSSYTRENLTVAILLGHSIQFSNQTSSNSSAVSLVVKLSSPKWWEITEKECPGFDPRIAQCLFAFLSY
ncbi:unnamed protein product [Fusarium graminearum]|uniref:Chromosome 4, complete genome n=1 Tax=Gibberella zeae (strain ATCC MYA-4620 / CBS 123657 / FGSC 9075 / NRRL 31084 / PH-1) TaxID=229533 RepID=A0A098DRL5_GIBZE|nr:unnamed protein product [Fusarium graminearum]